MEFLVRYYLIVVNVHCLESQGVPVISDDHGDFIELLWCKRHARYVEVL